MHVPAYTKRCTKNAEIPHTDAHLETHKRTLSHTFTNFNR